MQQALALARGVLGTTAPNPAVGCVLVKNGRIIGKGATGAGGRPHAETQALLNAKSEDPSGATAYITLEPCCHYGKTPPCADALINAGISTCVVALTDPNPKVSGGGLRMLAKAGIDIIEGICEQEAREINQGFFMTQTKNRPWVTLKLATSLDGKIACANGHSQWITSPKSRDYAHKLRSTHDAILVGVGTIIADNPALTCRLAGHEDRSPVRVILDANLETPASSQILTDGNPTWIYTTLAQPNTAITDYISLDPHKLDKILLDLASRGITRLLVEGGHRVATSFLQSGLVDELIWIRAPIIIGGDGMDAIGNLNHEAVDECPQLTLKERFVMDEDVAEVYGGIY